MTIKLHGTLQALLTLLQVANAYTQTFPKAAPFIMAGFTITQALLAVTSQYSNPDGTPAALPYKP